MAKQMPPTQFSRSFWGRGPSSCSVMGFMARPVLPTLQPLLLPSLAWKWRCSILCGRELPHCLIEKLREKRLWSSLGPRCFRAATVCSAQRWGCLVLVGGCVGAGVEVRNQRMGGEQGSTFAHSAPEIHNELFKGYVLFLYSII